MPGLSVSSPIPSRTILTPFSIFLRSISTDYSCLCIKIEVILSFRRKTCQSRLQVMLSQFKNVVFYLILDQVAEELLFPRLHEHPSFFTEGALYLQLWKENIPC